MINTMKKRFRVVYLLVMIFTVLPVFAQLQIYPDQQFEGMEDKLAKDGRVLSIGQIFELEFSLNGSLLLSGGEGNGIRVWNIETKEEFQQFLEHNDLVFSIEISNNGRFALSGGNNDELYWEIETGQRISSPYNFDYVNYSADLFPDGETALSVGNGPSDGVIWTLATGNKIGRLIGHSNVIYSVEISSNGRFAITGSRDTTIRLWNTETFQEIQRYSFPNEVYSVNFSPNEEFILASGEGEHIIIYNTVSGERHKEIQTNAHFIGASEYILNGQYIIAEERTSDTSIIRIRDSETGIVLVELLGNSGKLYALAVSPNETLIAAGGEDNIIFMWEIPSNLQVLRETAVYVLETQKRIFYDAFSQ